MLVEIEFGHTTTLQEVIKAVDKNRVGCFLFLDNIKFQLQSSSKKRRQSKVKQTRSLQALTTVSQYYRKQKNKKNQTFQIKESLRTKKLNDNAET